LLDSLIAQPALAVEERRKRGFLMLFLGIIIPTLLFLAISNWLTYGMNLAVILGGPSTVICLGLLYALRYRVEILPFTRWGVLYMLALYSYLLAVGGSEGFSYLWFYFFPLIVYFLMGASERATLSHLHR
jgi:hypothetical protein